MKIIALDAENVKRLKAVHIEPDGSLVIIGGRNAQGKTSVLDSIMYALAGKKRFPKKALRDGEEHGYVKLELDEGLVVTRTFTEGGGGELRVESKGALFRSPQAMLDKLVGKLGFDPMLFGAMEPAKRLEQLKTLVGLDFRVLDQRRQKVYDQRTEVSREKKSIEGTLSSLERTDDAPAEEISVAVLTDKLTAASAVYRGAEDYERRANEIEANAPKIEEKIVGLKLQVKKLKEEIDALVAEGLKIPEQAEELRNKAGAARESHQNPAEIRQRLQDSQGINAQVRVNQEMDALEELLTRKTEEYDKLTGDIKIIDDEKQAALNQANFPVEGLGFGDGEVTFNGQPWEQCALSEQIRVSVAMGFAMNPELRVLLIRDGSGLDADNLALVAELAELAKGQLFIERVGDKDKNAIVIEDGMVLREPPKEENNVPERTGEPAV